VGVTTQRKTVPETPVAAAPAAVAEDSVEDVLARVGAGDRSAFSELYRAYAARVFGLASHLMRDPSQAEEVTQEVFLEVWRRASRFNPARGSGTAWILTLAHSRSVDRVRKAQAAHERDGNSSVGDLRPDVHTVIEDLSARLGAVEFPHCLQSLTPLQRGCIVLAYFGGQSTSQVAAAIAAPVPTVKTGIRDGLVRLRDCMDVTTPTDPAQTC
jgi:RNA polymerase sigma-70 factor (ECF subfamily)